MIDEDLIQFVSFRLGSQAFAVEILRLRRVLAYQRPAPVAGAPPWVAGAIPFEGARLLVVDFRERLGLPTGTSAETRILVLDLQEGPLGFLVDEARRVERVDPAEIGPAPEVEGLRPGQVAGLVDLPGHPLVIVNPARLLSAAERAALDALKAQA